MLSETLCLGDKSATAVGQTSMGGPEVGGRTGQAQEVCKMIFELF
jgi:hypothetical protein